jgi:protein farnesyltransferase/geranylgeranyltransferase type-1 subunit alpha
MASTSTKRLTVDDLPTVFDDLEPIPQDDGPVSVSRIDYPPEFVQAYDYFRAILQNDERSERAFRLTELCLQFNPANYTVWHHRRSCLDALDFCSKDVLEKELQLAAQMGGDNPKNYQIWYHRRALLERLSDRDLLLEFCRHELKYTETVFAEGDSKNYHSWCYRQWVVQTIDSDEAWQQEVDFSDIMVQKDVRNNSAWNQRWFAARRGRSALTWDESAVELEYALAGARIDPYNESPWRYFVAVLKEQIKGDREKVLPLLTDYEEKVVATKNVLADAGKDTETCSNLMSAQMDILEFKGDQTSLERAKELSEKLTECDPIRAKYWKFRSKQLNDAMSKLS